MTSDWYCNISGDVSGPLADVQLRELADGGYLLPDDFVHKSGGGEWVPASRVNGLFPAGKSPTATGEENVADTPTEGRPPGHLPVAKEVSGPPLLARAKPPTRRLRIAPSDGLSAVDAAKAGASGRSRFRKRPQRLIASSPVLATSSALIVLAGVMYWLSRTETKPVRWGEDVSAIETRSGRPGPKSARQEPFDSMKGLDIDELNRLTSKPSDALKTRQTGTVVEDLSANPVPEPGTEKNVPTDEAVTSLGPQPRQGPGPKETMVRILEDDGFSPIPIPGLTDVKERDQD